MLGLPVGAFVGGGVSATGEDVGFLVGCVGFLVGLSVGAVRVGVLVGPKVFFVGLVEGDQVSSCAVGPIDGLNVQTVGDLVGFLVFIGFGASVGRGVTLYSSVGDQVANVFVGPIVGVPVMEVGVLVGAYVLTEGAIVGRFVLWLCGE